MKKLIINADDFGMCEGVSLGIIKWLRYRSKIYARSFK